MRDMKSADRRRRLRMIKVVEERSKTRFRSAVSALTIAADTQTARLDAKVIQEKLLSECKANLSTRLRVEHPGAAPMDLRMDRPYFIIGSDPACDLHLDHEEIKPRHFFLHWIDGRLFCCDIAPRTTFFPGRDSSSNGRWVDENPISIGPYQINLLDEKIEPLPDFSPLDRSIRLANEYPLLALQFEGVEQSNNVWPVNRTLTLIGRSSQCKLRLNHKSIANVQACLLRTENGCWLIDLIDDGTTGINGRAIQITPVDIGDILQLGSFRVEVVTMAVPSTVSIIEKPAAKPLPPIRFDRLPKNHPNPSPNESTVPSSEAFLKQTRPPVGESLPQTQLPPIKFDRPPKNYPRHPVNDSTAPSNEPILKKPIATNGETPQQKVLPPLNLQKPLEIVPSKAAIRDAHTTDVSTLDELVAQFIKQQELEVATLKKRLDALKRTYDSAMGQMISKKMRDMLEKPVLETLKSHDSMRETLTQLIQSHENHLRQTTS